MKKFNILLIIVTAFAINLFSNDYNKYVQDIENRFEKAYSLYEEEKFDEAKDGFTMAYFEVFENLEGPIRINVSAKKSYLMEAQFVDLRKMVKNRVEKEKIRNAIDNLVKEMHEVLPELDTHTIVAETSVQNTQNSSNKAEKTFTFDPNWEEALTYIQNNFNEALEKYDPENSKSSRTLIKDAQFEGYRNTQLEIMLRHHLSNQEEQQIQSNFTQLIKFIHTKPTKTALKDKMDSLLQELVTATNGLPPYNEKAEKSKNQKDFSKPTQEIHANFKQAFTLADKGETKKAVTIIQDTYFDVFEASGMENAVGAKDNSLKTTIEGYFGKIISVVKNKAPKDQREKLYNEFSSKLEQAKNLLQPESNSPLTLFIYSLTIILREGLEALLIVTAIVAYLVKSGNEDKMNIVYSSLGVAIILSFVTAWIMNILFGETSGVNREILEGAVMLIAAFLLLYVSYWLLSNAHAKKWASYINSQVKESLSSGSTKALWFTVFLAVYREGAETVLFYQALVVDASSQNSYLPLIGGFVLGVILLFIIYFILRFTAVKLPIKPFFIITGIFIFVMAFMFVGQGIAELIEGKVFIPTLIDGLPTITSLGIYPYKETLIPQAIVFILGITGLFFILKKQTRV